MNDNSKFKLGLFIIFSAVIFFAALFILGMKDRFKGGDRRRHITVSELGINMV